MSQTTMTAKPGSPLKRLLGDPALRLMMATALTIPFLMEPAMSDTDALLEAAQSGNSQTVASLIRAGATLDKRSEKGQTALLIATRANNIETARLLIDAGADVNAKDAIQDSPYLYAGARGHLEILRLTLAHGANLKSTNRYGGTALIPASERGHVETVKTLIEAGVDVNHVNNLGWTALLEAIILSDGGERHQQIVKLLLDAGASRDLADKDGVTPLQHAKTRGYGEIVAMLERLRLKR